MDDGLGRCIPEIRVDCALATCSGVELVGLKRACCQFHQAAKDSVCPIRGVSVKLLGGLWEVVLKYAPEQRLTHYFQLMTCVSSCGWPPLYYPSYPHNTKDEILPDSEFQQ